VFSPVERWVLVVSLLSFYNFAGAQATSANADAFADTFHLGVDWTQIDVPAPLGHVVGVADVISKLRAFPADITYLCHD
jgi:hypothetical protein